MIQGLRWIGYYLYFYSMIPMDDKEQLPQKMDFLIAFVSVNNCDN